MVVCFWTPQSSPRRRRRTDGAVSATPAVEARPDPGASLNPLLPCQHVNVSPSQKSCPSPQPGTVASLCFWGTRGLKLRVRRAAVGAGEQNYPHRRNYFSRHIISSVQGYGVTCPHAAQRIPANSHRGRSAMRDPAPCVHLAAANPVAAPCLLPRQCLPRTCP